MKLPVKISIAVAAFALAVSPAALAMGKPEGAPPYGQAHQEAGNGPNYAPGEPTPGPKAGLPAKAKAYGRYCQGESKKHVKGEKGTPFSRCVKNVNALRRQERKEEREHREEEEA